MATALYFDPKSPEDVDDFSFSFVNLLAPATSTTVADTIVTASVTISGPDNSLIATGAIINGPVVTTILSGGTAGSVYLIHYYIVSLQGVILQRSPILQVIEL